RRIRHTAGSVFLGLSDGSETRARCAVLCLPLNVIHDIEFSPPLSERKLTAATIGHRGCSIKMWIKARGVRVGSLATGGAGGLRWMFAEREGSDATTLIVGFGLVEESFDPTSRHDIAGSLNRF